MVSKKKRPPPGIETSEPSIQKKIKVDGAGTSNDGGVASLKTNSSRKHSKSKQDLVETDLKIEDVDIEEEDTHTNQILPVVRNEDFPDWPEADLLELMKRMESEIPAKDNLRFDSRAEKLDWSKICFGDYSAKQCKDMWIQIQKRLRRYRLLKEVLEDAKLWVSKPWTHFYRSSKQNRHPRMPRRPLSTYMLFYVEKKDKVAKENPGLEMTAVSKIIANMYKNLPAKKKQKYTDMAAKQRREYEEKLEQFYQEYPELVPKREAKVVSHDLGPRKPTPPFKLYFEDKLNQHKDDPDFDRQALLEKCKEQWRNMADKKKVVWINWALEEEAKYLEALKSQKLDDPEALSKVKTVLTKEERHLRERVAGKPEKPPNSGYSLFSRLMLVSADMKQVAPKERMAHISQLWKVLPEAQKMKYQEQVAHMLDQYKLEYASYLESLPEDKRREELLNNTPKRRAPVKYTLPKPVEEEDSSKKSVPPKKKTKEKEEEKTKPKKSENKTLFKGEPEPPPVNAYQLFLKSFIANSTHLSPEFREKEAPRYWQMLPDSDKAKYRKVLNEIKAKYIEDYEKFLKSLSQEQLKEYSLQKASLKKEESGADSSSDSDDSDDDSDSSDNQQGSGSGSSSDSDSDSSDSSDSNDSDGEEKDNGSDSSSSNSSDSD